MPRKKKAAAAAEHQPEAPATIAPATMTEVVQAVQDKLGAEVIEMHPPQAEARPAEDRGTKLPESHELDSIELGPEKGSARMRLFRSNRFQQMQIRFDEKPSDEVREFLHQEGWRWRGQETGWTRQLDKEAKWRTQADAERLFKEVANAIRAEKGLGPVTEYGR